MPANALTVRAFSVAARPPMPHADPARVRRSVVGVSHSCRSPVSIVCGALAAYSDPMQAAGDGVSDLSPPVQAQIPSNGIGWRVAARRRMRGSMRESYIGETARIRLNRSPAQRIGTAHEAHVGERLAARQSTLLACRVRARGAASYPAMPPRSMPIPRALCWLTMRPFSRYRHTRRLFTDDVRKKSAKNSSTRHALPFRAGSGAPGRSVLGTYDRERLARLNRHRSAPHDATDSRRHYPLRDGRRLGC